MLDPNPTTEKAQNDYISSQNNIIENTFSETEDIIIEPSASPANKGNDTENSLIQLFPISNSAYKNLKVTPAYDEGYYFIQYDYMGGAWNESDLIHICLTDYIAYCKEAYKIDPIKCIRFSIFVPMQSDNGAESIDHVLTIQMTKEIFNIFDWTDYENKPFYDIFVNNCENYYLAPMIEKYIKKEEITFSSYSKLFSFQ